MLETHNKKLYLEYCNRIGVKPLNDIIKVLDGRQNNISLQRENKENNNTSFECDIYGICLIMTQNIMNLIELNISNQSLNNTNILYTLCSGLKANKTIQKLILKNNSLDDDNISTLISIFIDTNHNILELDLSQNKIKDKGAECISKLIENNKCKLTYLNLSKNMIEFDYFGIALSNNETLLSFDISHNHYTTESFESILKGLQKNQTLQILDLSGMKVAANVNTLALADMISLNQALIEISIDLDIELIDENMISKLEEALLRNMVLVSIKSVKFDISLHNKLSSNLYRLLKANEWINNNYEHLCNNEAVECHELIKDLVQQKLEIMTAKLKQEGEGSVDTTDNQMTQDAVNYYNNNDNQFTAKSMEYRSFDDYRITDKIEKPIENRKEEIPIQTPKKFEDLENRLYHRLVNYIDQKVENALHTLRNPFEILLARLEHLEQNSKKIDERISIKDIDDYKSRKNNIDGQRNIYEAQITNLEQQYTHLTKELKQINQKLESSSKLVHDKKFNVTSEMDKQDSQSTNKRSLLDNEFLMKDNLEDFMQQRMDFEKITKEKFDNILEKMSDLNKLIGHLVQKQDKIDKVSKDEEVNDNKKKEKHKLEKNIINKLDHIFTEKLKDVDLGLKSSFSSLRTSVYETQNRLKNLEHCVLENAEINFKDFKKKVLRGSSQDNKENKHSEEKSKNKQGNEQNNGSNAKSKSKHLQDDEAFMITKTRSPKQQENKIIDNNDNPLTIKELQNTPSLGLIISKRNNNNNNQPLIAKTISHKARKSSNKSLDKSEIIEIPESIKRVKEDIKKKIESFRSDKKPDTSILESSSSMGSTLTKPHQQSSNRLTQLKGREGYHSALKIADMISTPSQELVNVLKNRGFHFEDK